MRHFDIRGLELTSEPDHVLLCRACDVFEPTDAQAERAAIRLKWHPRRAAAAIEAGLRAGLFRKIH